jgi:hypothetical protein
MDELKTNAFGDSGRMPDTVRSRVRRRRITHRVQTGGAVLCVALVAALGVLMTRPSVESPDNAWRGGAVISIDDPMFDALDRGLGENRVDPRWRAGARLDGDWVLEM